MADHDLLIKIETKLDGLTQTVTSANQANADCLEKLSAEKADRKDMDALRGDHEPRIRSLESVVWRFGGGIALLQLILTILTILALMGKLHGGT